MTIMTIRHPVADVPAWRSVYDQADALRQAHGCTSARVFVDSDDASVVFVAHEFPTRQAAEGFAGDPQVRAAMEQAGVAGPPRFEYYDEA